MTRDTMKKRLLGLFILAFGAALLGGCSSTQSIKPGTWKLRVVGHQFSMDRSDEEAPDRELMPWTLVEVLVDWRDHPKHGMLQTIEIKTADPTASHLPPISGFIGPYEKDDSALYLDVIGSDDTVKFRMLGAVRDADFVRGSVVGRKRLREHEGFQGKFELVLLNDEQTLLARRGLQREIRGRQKRRSQTRSPEPEDTPSQRRAEPRSHEEEEIEDTASDRLPMRPGIWILEIDGRDLSSTSDDFETLLQPTKVYIRVDASQDSDDLPVEIHFTRGKDDFDPDREPITGSLREDEDDPGRYDLNVLGGGLEIDNLSYDFRMKSRELSASRVRGLVLLRDSQNGRKGYEGSFTLRRTK